MIVVKFKKSNTSHDDDFTDNKESFVMNNIPSPSSVSGSASASSQSNSRYGVVPRKAKSSEFNADDDYGPVMGLADNNQYDAGIVLTLQD